MIDSTIIYTMSEADARRKIREWNSDKKTLKFFHAHLRKKMIKVMKFITLMMKM